ncbi:MAG: DMT family transporter [Magnetococcales bacterium]|nr:DMT family transporter [Magnetococcales bacterium]
MAKSGAEPNHSTAVALVLLAGAGFSVVAAVVKAVSVDLHPFQLVFLRTFFGLLWVTPFLFRRESGFTLASGRVGMHVLRTLAGILAMGSAFYAYSALPLALVISLGFSTPLWMVGLAWLFLEERPGWLAILATLAGFGGVLIMGQTRWEGFSAGWIAALASPFFEALVLVLLKRMTTTEPILTIIATYGILSALFWLPVAVWVWHPMGGQDLLLMIVVAGVASLSQAATINAYARAPATLVTPLYYVRLLFIVIIGYFFFREVPSWTTCLGAVIIIGSNLFIIHHKG